MRLRIRHRTTLRYDQPVGYAIQSLRMLPRPHDGQRIEDWSLTAGGRRQPLVGYLDGYGNWVHQHSRVGMHEMSEIVVTGVVQLFDTGGVVSGIDEPLPPFFYLRQTAATHATPEVAALALSVAGEGAGSPDALERIATEIMARVACVPVARPPHATAGEALAAGSGSIPDLIHLMLACARVLGVPARCVSGYRHDGDGSAPRETPHAWMEAHLPERGWVAMDPFAGTRVADRHVRVAAGLDWLSAAPVRSLWRGAAEEAETMAVQVAAAGITQ